MKLDKNIIFIMLLFLAVLASYGNIFQNEFVWDDNTFITSNKKITSFEYIPYHFTHESRNSLYRPLRETFYIVTYSIWDLNTFGYHLNSIILHSLITFFVFFIVSSIAKNREIALFAALLFAAHPVHTARVTNMTAAFDMLGLLFFLIAFYLFIKYRQDNLKKHYFYSIIFYALALLSSEEAIAFIGILLLYDICFATLKHISKIKQIIREYAPYVILTFFYVITHIQIVGKVGRTLTYFEDSFYITFLNSIKAIAFYFKLLIFPVNLSIYQELPKATSFLSISFLMSLLILIFAAAAMIYSFKRSKIIFFSFGWFFTTMLLFYNFIPKPTLLADRYLYFPSIGFSLLLGYLVFRIRNFAFLKKHGRALSIGALLVLVVFYSGLTIERNAEWQNEEMLLKKAVETVPISTNAHWALADYYKKIKNYEMAKYHLHTAVNLSSRNYIALELLGAVYAETKEFDKAIFYLKKAVEIAPAEEEGYYRANNDLGLVYSYIGDFDNALFYLKRAIEINPQLSKAYNDIGTVYGQIGELDLAIENINQAIEINPSEGSYYLNLAAIYEFLGDREKADELLEIASELQTFREGVRGRQLQ